MRFHNNAAFVVLLAIASFSACATNTRPAAGADVDHIMLGVRDLNEGIAEFHRLTGVEPLRGGSHPGRGTENALVSLGESTYLEIIAPQPGAAAGDEFLSRLRRLDTLTPIGWAAGVDDAATIRPRLARAGLRVTAAERGSRRTPSGTMLGWTTFGLAGYESEAVPFFIQWDAATTHPSRSSPQGCTLRTLSLADPNTAPITKAVQAAGLSVVVTSSERTSITVEISCGERLAKFSSR